jgi:glutamyl-tRNA synthetase/glutamyl-Q tRNA(Asp) synthetase
VLNAEYVWNAARARGGRVLLRIEDHDRERCRPEYENGILDDLDWLGYRPDVYPTDAFRAGRCEGRQSDRGAAYRDAADRLRALGLVYACDCTRRQIAASQPGERESRYPGTCRDRGLAVADGIGWRIRLESTTERFVDERLGTQEQTPQEQCGDVLIRDRRGHWTYQFCAAVDDFLQGVDLVVRGEDLLASTGRQIAIARLLGRERPPAFLHHPLIMKTPVQKLSKSDGDTGIRELRRRGFTPAEVKAAALAAAAVQ